jgi:uncharacterized protein YuzE
VDKDNLIQLTYDRDADVLYVSLGTPRRAVSREIGDDLLLRIDPATDEIVGLTVLNLSTRGDSDPLPLTAMFAMPA